MGEGIKTRSGKGVKATFLYSNGNEYTSLTGGWAEKDIISSPTQTKNADRLTIALNSTLGQKGAFYTTNQIDLTDINKLVIKWSQSVTGGSNSGRLITVSTDTSGTNVVAQNFRNVATSGTEESELDVSGLSGSYYIVFIVANGGYEPIFTSDLYELKGIGV